MRKLDEMIYQRPSIDSLELDMRALFREFAEAVDFSGQWAVFLRILARRDQVLGMFSLVEIRHSVDTRDAFYDGEQNYVDAESPRLSALNDELYSLLLESRWSAEFEQKLGSHFFNSMRLAKRAFSQKILDDLADENRETSRYGKLLATALIPFEGKPRTLTELMNFFEDPDRSKRQNAQEAYWSYFRENGEELDTIYDRLVRLRDGMARKLGYGNYIQMGYDRFGRTDYGPGEVARFREGIVRHVVPEAERLCEEQRQRLGLKRLTYYDLPYLFPNGNPKPQGGTAWMKAQAQTMYDEMAPEAGDFFRLLDANQLLDLDSKAGKGPGGYCTLIVHEKIPFIFANFNGTSADVDVLTHEYGHAFQVYKSRNHLLNEQRFPGMESAEIHSMGMEYIAYPWMERFFGPDTRKYFYAHQAGNILFLPYGALVDAFQHEVYAAPEASPVERRQIWRRLERVYTPWKDYETNPFLEHGGYWQRQGHIYNAPFYYIDYCLAQIVAMQVFARSREDRARLWQDYVAISEVGGTIPFREILRVGHFQDPFDEQAVRDAIRLVRDELGSVDGASLR